jgi:hypothetical protein
MAANVDELLGGAGPPGGGRRLIDALLSGPDDLWPQEDWPAIWRHQLSTEIADDLAELGTSIAVAARQQLDPGLITYGLLLGHPNPPLQVLVWIKDCAKRQMQNDALLPKSIAALIYYLSIAVARVRLGVAISNADDGHLRDGLRWAGRQEWIDEPTRRLIAYLLSALPGTAGPGEKV